METIIAILFAAIGAGCGAAYLSIRRLRRITKLQPILGVVAPQKAQDASESTKTVRKVK
jgi:hypothetical protein